MITSTKTLVTVTKEDSHFVARCQYNETAHEWLQSMGFRWSKRYSAWSVAASTTAAIRIIGQAPESVWLEKSCDVVAMAQQAATEVRYDQAALRKVDSWRHQAGAYCYAQDRIGSLWAMGMGTGKSKPAVEVIVNTGARRSLILCPTSVRGVWRRELEKWSAVPLEVLVLDQPGWSVQRQAEESNHFVRMAEARGLPVVIVQNYESASWARGNKGPWRDWSLRQDWDVVILDESHRVGKPHTKVSKFCDALRPKAAKRLCLSGTPLPHSPLDIFGQARFLCPEVFGASWAQFRGRYAKTGHFGADHIVGYINQEELSELMASFTYQVGSEVLDLPEIKHVDVVGRMPAAAQKVYDKLEKEFCVAVREGVLTAANGLVKLLRLQQLTGGFIQLDEENEPREFDDTKEQLLADLIEDVPEDEPFVVFAQFKHDLNVVRRIAEKLKRPYGEISGRQRDLTPNATMPEEIRVMGVQMQSGGVGIDLTRACYGAYFSTGYSLSNFDQSVARLHRPGQTRPVTFWHLVLDGTVDQTIYKAIDKRREIVDAVIDRLKGEVQ